VLSTTPSHKCSLSTGWICLDAINSLPGHASLLSGFAVIDGVAQAIFLDSAIENDGSAIQKMI
jgi:hypothetical protein